MNLATIIPILQCLLFVQFYSCFAEIYIPQTEGGKFCVIPFVHKGVVYHDCTNENSDRRWCFVDSQFSSWDYCKSHPKEFEGCQIATPNITQAEVDEILNEHNRIRAAMKFKQMRKLEWNSELAQKAQAAANKCSWEHTESLLCAGRELTGQNLYTSYFDKEYPSALKWTNVIAFWSGEEKNYDVATNVCAAGKICGHFTQVVWAKTGQIGCGKAYCHNVMPGTGSLQYSIQYYCNYHEPGNYQNTRPFELVSEKRCDDCHMMDKKTKFKCNEDKLCERCHNDLTGCVGLDDVEKAVQDNNLCADTDTECERNKHLCAFKTAGPKPIMMYVKKCRKTCGDC